MLFQGVINILFILAGLKFGLVYNANRHCDVDMNTNERESGARKLEEEWDEHNHWFIWG